MKYNRHPLEIAWKARRDERKGPQAIIARQQARLAELVEFARKCSPYYRSLYAGLPAHVSDVCLLPPVTKPELMQNFDGWVTDWAGTLLSPFVQLPVVVEFILVMPIAIQEMVMAGWLIMKGFNPVALQAPGTDSAPRRTGMAGTISPSSA